MSDTRLTLPIRFKKREHAVAAATTHSLWSFGAVVLSSDGCWRVMIHTSRPDSVQQFLRQHMPGVVWLQEEKE